MDKAPHWSFGFQQRLTTWKSKSLLWNICHWYMTYLFNICDFQVQCTVKWPEIRLFWKLCYLPRHHCDLELVNLFFFTGFIYTGHPWMCNMHLLLSIHKLQEYICCINMYIYIYIYMYLKGCNSGTDHFVSLRKESHPSNLLQSWQEGCWQVLAGEEFLGGRLGWKWLLGCRIWDEGRWVVTELK